MTIKYVKGDATEPEGEGNKVIAHIVNNIGAWGAGFVTALSRKWHRPETWYRVHADNMKLGCIQMVPVSNGLYVCNMVAQDGIGLGRDGREPIRYDALITCLRKLNKWINGPRNELTEYLKPNEPISVHMPFIGTGLASGKWAIIEPIIDIELATVPVTVYEYEPKVNLGTN